MMKTKILLPLLVLIVVIGCKKEDVHPENIPFVGTWKCIGFKTDTYTKEIQPIDCKPCYQITFKQNGSLYGKTTSNDIEGRYEVNLGKKTLKIPSLGGTKVGEIGNGSLYFDLLKSTTSYLFTNKDRLMLYTKNNSLLFEKYDPEKYNNCGCDTKKTTPVPSTQGKISYRKQTNANDYYVDKYWITIHQNNLTKNYIVCNEEAITENIKTLLQKQDSVQIVFSGKKSTICKEKTNHTNISYERITLSNTKDNTIYPEAKIIKELPLIQQQILPVGETLIVQSKEKLEELFNEVPTELQDIDFDKQSVILTTERNSNYNVETILHNFKKTESKYYKYSIHVSYSGNTNHIKPSTFGIVIEKIPSSSIINVDIQKKHISTYDVTIVKELPLIRKKILPQATTTIVQSNEKLKELFNEIPTELKEVDFSKYSVILGTGGTGANGIGKLEHTFKKIDTDIYKYSLTVTYNGAAVFIGPFTFGIIAEKIPSNSTIILDIVENNIN